jgi:hypothetical protein
MQSLNESPLVIAASPRMLAHQRFSTGALVRADCPHHVFVVELRSLDEG